jgi:hypothetical protein
LEEVFSSTDGKDGYLYKPPSDEDREVEDALQKESNKEVRRQILLKEAEENRRIERKRKFRRAAAPTGLLGKRTGVGNKANKTAIRNSLIAPTSLLKRELDEKQKLPGDPTQEDI